MNLTALESFNCVVGHGGFGRASRASGQAKATLSRHVRELEKDLGVRLVERDARSLRLTEEGASLHARTDRLLAEIQEAGAEIGANLATPRGRLRVSVPVLFAHVAMGRLAADFSQSYPEVLLEVVAEDRIVDLVAEGYDAVVRVNPKHREGLVGHCILRDETLVVAPPNWGPLLSGAGAASPIPAVVLTNDLDAKMWSEFRRHRGRSLATRPVLCASSLPMVRDAVRAGAGIALLPRSIAAEDLAAGRLVSWGAAGNRTVEVWVLHISRRLVSRKVTAFMSFLVSAYPNRVLS